MSKAPYINRRIQGTKRYKHKVCPYSLCDQTERIPLTEKAEHTVTSGAMSLDIRGGHGRAGWRCDDPNCPYFLGTATTPVIIKQRVTKVDQTTGKYTVEIVDHEVPIGCSGIKFWEM